MEIEILTSPVAFKERAWDFMLAREAEHNLLLGITGNLLRKPIPGDIPEEKRPIFCLAEENGKVVAVALMTPPFRMVLSAGDTRVWGVLADHLFERKIKLPGVLGPNAAAMRFAEAYTQRSGQRVMTGRSERIYQLTTETIAPPTTMPVGELIEAETAHVDRLTEWLEGFRRDVHDDANFDARTHIMAAINDHRLYVWMTVQKQPVCMAAWTSPTVKGIRLGLVYTPPEHRRQGYASAAVWALSQQLLTTKWQRCFLFTDLSNPTSNSIYQKIGYRPVCDYQELHFR